MKSIAQWGLEYQTLEYPAHFKVFSFGRVHFGTVLTIQKLASSFFQYKNVWILNGNQDPRYLSFEQLCTV